MNSGRRERIPEDEFHFVADPEVWVRRAWVNWQRFAPAMPADVIGWPKSDKLQDIADHLDILECDFGQPYRADRNGVYSIDVSIHDVRAVPVETLMGHLLARASMIGRLARFLRGVRTIEKRADAKAKCLREETHRLQEQATAFRKRLGTLSINPLHRVTDRLRQARLSTFQARKFASAEPGRIHLLLVDPEGTASIVGMTFQGEHRYGKWKVHSGEFDRTMLVIRHGETTETAVHSDELERLQGHLKPSSLFIDPNAISSLTADIESYQKAALATEAAHSQISDQDRARHDHVLASLSSLIETKRRRDIGVKRRAKRQARLMHHYRGRIEKSARRLLLAGIPVNAEDGSP